MDPRCWFEIGWFVIHVDVSRSRRLWLGSRSSSSTALRAQPHSATRVPRRQCATGPPLPHRLQQLPIANANNNLFSMLWIASRAVRPGLDSHTPRALCKYAAFFLCLFVAQFLQILNFILSRARLEVGDPTAPWRKAAPPSPA